MSLQDYRKQIDRVDSEILRLFEERMGISLQIARYKKENGIPVFDPTREKEKLSTVSDPYMKKLYSSLFEISKQAQRKVLSVEKDYNKKLLVINGPNLNMLGSREPEIYGNKTYSDLLDFIHAVCFENGMDCEIVQSNCEGEIVDLIQNALNEFDGIIINPAAYTHTSIAILDSLRAVGALGLPAIEVHLTDINEREDYRKLSYAGMGCVETFSGMGFDGYKVAVEYFKGEKL